MSKKYIYILRIIFIFFLLNTNIVFGSSNTWQFDNAIDYTASNASSFNFTGSIATLVKNTFIHKGSITNATTYNGAYDVVVEGNYAYMTNNLRNSVSILDISNPASPTLVTELVNNNGTLRLSGAAGIVKDGNYLYIASQVSDALQIINVTNPLVPTAAGQLRNTTTLNGARGIAKVGNYVYLACDTYDALQVINVTNPAAPAITGTIRNTTTLNGARDVKIVGNYAYVTSYNRDALSILDISNPASPTFITEVRDRTNLNGAWGLEIVGNYAYVSSYLNNSVRIIDITTPTAPVALSNISGGSYSLTSPRDLLSYDNKLFITSFGNSAVNVADITNPTAPVYVTKVIHNAANPLLNGAYGIYNVGDYFYVSGYNGDSLEIMKWSYDSTGPYIIPNSNIVYSGSIDKVTTTYGANNAGNVKYQISKDNGVTWYYLNGINRISTTSGISNSNTEAEINSEIQTFNGLAGGTGEFKIKAFFNSNGSQQVEIDSLKVDYTSGGGNEIIDFESPGGYTVSSGVFSRVTTDKYEGSYSIESGNTANNSTSCFDVSRTLYNDYEISFYKKVSSELNYDFLHFYIDGVEQNKWSGTVAWSLETFNVGNGVHNFSWCYSKDGSVNSGSDKAWVDYIELKEKPTIIIPEISILDFEVAGGYTVTTNVTGTNTDWTRVTSQMYEGSYSIESQISGNNQTACFERTQTISPTENGISFFYKVSSELNYDFLRFYINGVEQNNWSGEINWTKKSYNLSSGTYTLGWCYTKDGSVNTGSDKAWIDYVTVTTEPPILSEITPVATPTNDNTPDYTFYSPVAGAISYSGSCSSSTTTAVVGNNTITLNSLADGIYTDCTIQVLSSPIESIILPITNFTIDTTGINITINSPVDLSTISNNDFSINVDYFDSQTGVNTSSIILSLYKWNGTSYGADISGTYVNFGGALVGASNATYQVTTPGLGQYKVQFSIEDNIGNISISNSVFNINNSDTLPPNITINFPNDGIIYPNGNLNVNISYNDLLSNINTGSIVYDIRKWNGTSWGTDISGSYILSNNSTTSLSTYNISKLGYGKYKMYFYIEDSAGNGDFRESVFYIDEPSFEINTADYLSNIGLIYGAQEITVTVKTVGVPYELQISKDNFSDGNGNLIIDWDGATGVGYDFDPYTGVKKSIVNYPVVGSGALNLNTNGDLNTYIHKFKIKSIVGEEQAAGNYEMNILFRGVFNY
ncbi:MAG: hypothetical protein PHV23_00535 [Candidatus Gracilibacteria bacterium]|nr:hypothetical protein [Candidatus Gracilibacteria bacterium]